MAVQLLNGWLLTSTKCKDFLIFTESKVDQTSTERKDNLIFTERNCDLTSTE